MVSEALLAMTDAPADEAFQSVHPIHLRRVRDACEFIEQHLHDELTLQIISQAAGLNPNSLQRVFRAVQGVTIFEYVRSSKLDRAREALERDSISVGKAAYLAGYTSSANFATAFRRRFGVSPKQIRARY
jgi:AraC-like DNA-binding protein